MEFDKAILSKGTVIIYQEGGLENFSVM